MLKFGEEDTKDETIEDEATVAHIAATLTVLTFVTQILSAVPVRLDFKDFQMGEDRIKRTFAIDSLSSGRSS